MSYLSLNALAICAMSLLVVQSVGAQAAPPAKGTCTATFNAASSSLTADSIQVGNAKYQVQMTVQTTPSLGFTLASAIVTSNECTDFGTFVSDTATLPDVTVGSDHYQATLKIVPGSSPARFTLSAATKTAHLIPDAGLRVSGASNPFATVSSSGVTYLGYADSSTGQTKFQSATDGLTFGNATALTYANRSVDSRKTLMPDGKTWRLYQWDSATKLMTSYVSTDGNTFTAETGTRYTPSTADNGSIGVYDAYIAKDNSLILIYLGDLTGKNNLRMARSTDNGVTFTYYKGNVLGDDNDIPFVDTKVILLPDGRWRMIGMRSLALHSFISSDGLTFTREPGYRVSVADFVAAGVTIYTLNDPVMVLDKDGKLKVYVASATTPPPTGTDTSSSATSWAIVSATWKD